MQKYLTLIASTTLALALISCGGSSSTAVGNRVTPTPGDDPATRTNEPQLRIVSNRSDMVSEGDVLVEVIPAAGDTISTLKTTLNGSDISSQIALRDNQRWMGLVKGLVVGNNTLVVTLNGKHTLQQTLRNYPNEGPIFAGPQVERLRCQNGGEAKTCKQPVEYTFLYKSSNPTSFGLQPFDPASPPDDVATTTTDHGVTVPFIVRQERGYQDRDEYKILTLFNPAQPWTAWQPQPQWNHKLLITHGGGCGTSFTPGSARLNDFSGTFDDVPVLEQSYVTALGLGFAVMSTALNNNGHNCDLVLQAESMVMAKERLVEQYGELRYTIGTGCSGGSLTQTTVANAYPGIYQGLITMCAYPDTLSAGLQFADLHLMRNYFENPQSYLSRGVPWIPTQWGDVEGHLTHINAVTADEGLFKGATDPTGDCYGPNTYHPDTNPDGQRCSIIDALAHIVGLREQSAWSPMEMAASKGFAKLPLGNDGVQYGLLPFLQGRITAQQFADLNIHIGGLDIDIQPQTARTVADPQAVKNIYRSGMVNVANNLNTVPILNFAGSDPGIAHDAVHAWWVRWRLDREHKSHANHVMWVGATPLIGDVRWVHDGITAMDQWLAAIEKDTSAATIAKKIVSNKPADMQDRCILPTGVAAVGEACVEVFRYAYAYGTPRTQAGDDIYADNLTCVLKPYNPEAEYGPLAALFLPGQLDALKAVFDKGVCDYSKPSPDMVKTETWLTYLSPTGGVIVGGEKLPALPAGSRTGWQSPAFRY